MRDGYELIGWGMATETYPGKNLPASALVRLTPNGRVLVITKAGHRTTAAGRDRGRTAES
jgi:xanthine dehydrogenase YagR molybdenum-binding subunit